jgi:hypothetical protein
LELVITPEDGVDPELLKELLLSNRTSLPCQGSPIYNGDKVVGHIRKAKSNVYPKPFMQGDE